MGSEETIGAGSTFQDGTVIGSNVYLPFCLSLVHQTHVFAEHMRTSVHCATRDMLLKVIEPNLRFSDSIAPYV